MASQPQTRRYYDLCMAAFSISRLRHSNRQRSSLGDHTESETDAIRAVVEILEKKPQLHYEQDRRIVQSNLHELKSTYSERLDSQSSNRLSWDPFLKKLDAAIEKIVEQAITSVVKFQDQDVTVAIELLRAAGEGEGMKAALNSLATQGDILLNYACLGDAQFLFSTGDVQMARGDVYFFLATEMRSEREPAVRFRLYADGPGDMSSRANEVEQPWAKLVAVLNPQTPVPIDGLLVYTFIEMEDNARSIAKSGIIKGLPSHNIFLKEAAIKKKMKRLLFDGDGARMNLSEVYRASAIAYMVLTIFCAIAVGAWNVGARSTAFAQIQDSVTVITVTWITVFGFIKLVTNDPDVLRNLALKIWKFRTNDQIYWYLGDEKAVKKVIGKDMGEFAWLSATDLCFSRAILSGKIELRGGLDTEDLQYAGWITGKNFSSTSRNRENHVVTSHGTVAYDILKGRSYVVIERNGKYIIDKRNESGYPGIRNLDFHIFESQRYGGSLNSD